MKLVICSSAAFYKHVCELSDQLEKLGLEVVIPETAHIMRESGDFEVEHYKTWYKNEADAHIKKHKMDTHIDEVTKGDAILVVNDEKHSQPGYIGPNVLIEMAIAYYQKKKIYILNNIQKDAPLYEEVLGMGATQLNGDIQNIDTI